VAGARVKRFLAGARKKDIAFWVYLAARVMSGVVNIVALKYLIALLTRSDYGDWVYYRSVGLMLLPIASLSLPAAMQRWYFDRKKDDSEGQAVLISTTFKLIFGSAAVVSVGSCALYLSNLQNHWAFFYFAVLTPGNLLMQYFNYVTRTRNDYILYFINACIQSLLTLALLMAAVSAWGDVGERTFLVNDRLLATIAIWGICIWGANILNTVYYSWQGFLDLKLPTLPLKEIRALIKFSVPLSGTYFLGWTLQSADLIILGNLSTSWEVADYGLAVMVAATVAIITQSALSDWPPFYYGQMRDDRPDRDARIANRVRRFLWMHIITMLVLRLIASFAYDLLGADEYRAGVEYIDYLMLGNFFLLAGNLFAAGLGYVKKTHLTMVTFIVPGVLNVLLNLALVPAFGARAAALTTLGSYALLALLSWQLGKKYYHFTERRKLATVMIIATVVALFPIRLIASAFGF